MAAEYPGVQTETDPVAEADLAAHVAAADPHPGYQKESEKAANNGYASLDSGGQVPLDQLGNAPAGGGGGADASDTVKGISKLSVAPVSSTDPIAVGDNDPRNTDQRVPTDGSVTAAKVNTALKPSGTAASTDESLRRLGTGATHAAAGDDSRFPSSGEKNALAGTSGTPGSLNKYVTDGDARNTDARTPTDASVTDAKIASTLSQSKITSLVTDLAAKAPLASPALTGTPTVPTAAQGTNTTQAASTAYVQTESGLLIPKSLVDAKGDLLVGTADNTVGRLAVGSDGQVLTADSAQASGVKWAAGGGGSDPTIKLGRLTDSVTRTLATGFQYALTWDTEAEDTDTMIDLTATASLTGTVATNGSTTLTGTGTAFTTEVLIGHEITVNGQTRRVTAIASNISLTVETAFSGTASGLSAVRKLNDRITAKTAGVFIPQLTVFWAGNTTGYRELIAYTGSGSSGAVGTLVDAEDRPPTGAAAFWTNLAFRPVRLAVNDFIRFDLWQNSGTTLTLSANSRKASLLRLGA